MPYNPNIHHRRSIRLKGYDYSQAGLYFITICCQDRACLFGKITDGKMILNEMGIIAQREWLKTTEIRPNVELGEFVIMPNHMHGIIRLLGRGELHSPYSEMGVFNTPQPPDNEMGVFNTPQPPDNELGVFNTPQRPNNEMGVFNTPQPPNNEMGVFNTPQRSDNNYIMGECNSPPQGPSNNIGAIVRGYKSSVTKQLNLLNIGRAVWQRNYHEHIIRNESSYQTISNYIINNPVKWNDDKFYNELK